ncbi:MAG: DUF1592 domain-containing protein [Planctomycetaceae bacterium]|nr:DUF1592 domain-containing protein [Planctomycetaceae bacterium]
MNRDRARSNRISFVTAAGGWLSFAFMATVGLAQDRFANEIQPLLSNYCLTCHSTEKQEGELDLERFSTISLVTEDAGVWEHVLEQLSLGTMPPADAPQLSALQKQTLIDWIQATLDDVALANAGDPGPVVLRRLSNHEYTYTLRDLTGVDSLDPAREFPVDGAAGEGFTNVGSALVMSPALLTKYLDAAKEISQHAVLLPRGIRFSASTSPQDWTTEALDKIRAFYARHTTRATGDTVQLQGIDLDMGTAEGRLPLADYLAALQMGAESASLSPKYLQRLKEVLESSEPSILLDPLRQKFQAKQLTSADIEAWQKVLWKFSLVGHVGRPNGPQAWQEAAEPFLTRQEFRLPLHRDQEQRVFLVSRSAGDGNQGDQVVWENARLVAKGRPDIALARLDDLLTHLQTRRAAVIEHAIECLDVLAKEQANASDENPLRSTPLSAPPSDLNSPDDRLVSLWRDYLGLRSGADVKLEPPLPNKIERTPDYAFIQGWTSGEDLSVLANSSDATVRIPGTMLGRSVAVHPSPSRSVVVAWECPQAGEFQISGRVLDAHLDCGDGVAWSLEVRRGNRTEILSTGATEGGTSHSFGPFEKLKIEAGQVVALVISPREHHVCDMTTIDLTIRDQTTTWDLASDVSPNILQSNPIGPWHFTNQPVATAQGLVLPEPMMRWCDAPSAERAKEVQEFLRDNFPLSHPLLASAWQEFQANGLAEPISSTAPQVLEYVIPAELASDAEFVVSGTLAVAEQGSVQLQVTTSPPQDSLAELRPELPIVVGERSDARSVFQQSFTKFRDLFPIALCYSRIVPVDEVVTLRLFYREDEHLQRLILDERQIADLNQLWSELLFVSEAPIKQVAAFEQIYEFATQDRSDLVVEFEKMREPIHQAAAAFREQQVAAQAHQLHAVIEFARKAWRRPLTTFEQTQLNQMSPRLALARVLASPTFLYRSESPGEQTGPISDWELATRLSYFLWSSLPDDELFELAASGRLREPEVLRKQVRRMLQDERKVRRLATEFGCQYLHVRDMAQLNEKSERHFPTFVNVRGDMQEEVTRFFIDLFQNNRPVIELLDADYTFVNASLAEHYGLPYSGAGWQRVEGLKAHGRGGMLGFAATLAKHSGASRTSAILRGMWLSEVVLGEKTPNPPKGVPTLPEEPPSGLTERELIERHSSDPACAGCHRRIDPYGFALEGFDAIGRLRSAETRTVLYDGTEVGGLADLRDYLVQERKDVFAKQFARKLVGYALGRSVQLSDQPLIEGLVQTDSPRVGDMIEQIVLSPQFLQIRGQ